ncbi:MBL fold metallo-hydrolase [Kocuria palustris]|uniref:MBL fold metallo-hydrolase n=1 Tax=Kocuria palustris TaxID=71999 RepID=UPI0011A70525|nr:MBL fold metallo-hydrolase [Kocuria palustris]
MTQDIAIHPLVSPWGRFGLFTFLIDGPELAIVDTGVAASPAEGMAPELERLGRRIEDVRWILLTHGHIDHLGGAAALRELTGGRARVVIHEADADHLRRRRAHVENYLATRARYLDVPDAEDQQTTMAQQAISGELEPDVLVSGGEVLELGGVQVKVHSIPGHTAGSVAYEVLGQSAVFVGDAVQIHGAANGFPGYEDPDAYRDSLLRLRDEIRPQRLYLGHPYRSADGAPFGVEVDEEAAADALQESIDIEQRVRAAAIRAFEQGLAEADSPYSPFMTVAEDLGYTGDPALEPSPFFTTLHGYRRRFEEGRLG